LCNSRASHCILQRHTRICFEAIYCHQQIHSNRHSSINVSSKGKINVTKQLFCMWSIGRNSWIQISRPDKMIVYTSLCDSKKLLQMKQRQRKCREKNEKTLRQNQAHLWYILYDDIWNSIIIPFHHFPIQWMTFFYPSSPHFSAKIKNSWYYGHCVYMNEMYHTEIMKAFIIYCGSSVTYVYTLIY
jgi:hypothetical protein